MNLQHSAVKFLDSRDIWCSRWPCGFLRLFHYNLSLIKFKQLVIQQSYVSHVSHTFGHCYVVHLVLTEIAKRETWFLRNIMFSRTVYDTGNQKQKRIWRIYGSYFFCRELDYQMIPDLDTIFWIPFLDTISSWVAGNEDTISASRITRFQNSQDTIIFTFVSKTAILVHTQEFRLISVCQDCLFRKNVHSYW